MPNLNENVPPLEDSEFTFDVSDDRPMKEGTREDLCPEQWRRTPIVHFFAAHCGLARHREVIAPIKLMEDVLLCYKLRVYVQNCQVCTFRQVVQRWHVHLASSTCLSCFRSVFISISLSVRKRVSQCSGVYHNLQR